MSHTIDPILVPVSKLPSDQLPKEAHQLEDITVKPIVTMPADALPHSPASKKIEDLSAADVNAPAADTKGAAAGSQKKKAAKKYPMSGGRGKRKAAAKTATPRKKGPAAKKTGEEAAEVEVEEETEAGGVEEVDKGKMEVETMQPEQAPSGGVEPLKGGEKTVPVNSLQGASAEKTHLPPLTSVEAAQTIRKEKGESKADEMEVERESGKIEESKKEVLSQSSHAPLPTDDSVRGMDKAARQGSSSDEPMIDGSGVALGGKSGLTGGMAAGGEGVSFTDATSQAAGGGAGNVATAEISQGGKDVNEEHKVGDPRTLEV